MSVPTLLLELRRRNIEVWAEDDQLKCAAPTGVLTPDLRDRLRQEKGAIVQFLRSADALARQQRGIVPLQPRGERIPVFAVPGHNGNVFSFRFLAQQLGEDQPFFGLQPPGVDGECDPLTDLEALAAYFAEQIRAFRPEGPCIIVGHCAGGGTAFELARQLVRQGTPVPFLALFGSPYPTWFRTRPQILHRVSVITKWIRQHLDALASLTNRERARYIAAKLAERWQQWRARRTPEGRVADPEGVQRAKVERATIAALRGYDPGRYVGRVGLFLPSWAWRRRAYALDWREVASEVEEYHGTEGCQTEVMLHEPHVGKVAEQFRECVTPVNGTRSR